MQQKTIDNAKKRLFSGQLVIFPTETVYGIGANAQNKTAIKLIYKTKKYGIPCERKFEINSSSIIVGFVSNGCF